MKSTYVLSNLFTISMNKHQICVAVVVVCSVKNKFVYFSLFSVESEQKHTISL